MGRLVATTFVIVAAVKAVEKLQKIFKRKKRPDVREGIIWHGKAGQAFARIVASGPEGADDVPPVDAPESIWQITRAMEKRAMKEAREREFFYKAKLNISRTVHKRVEVRDDVSVHEDDDDDASKQVVAAPPAARGGPLGGGFPGMGF